MSMMQSSAFDVAGVHTQKALEKQLQQIQDEDDTLDTGIMMFDLNNLKIINDTYGHEEGDVFIQTFASFLTRILTENSYLARFGGDEFLIIFNKISELSFYGCMEKIKRNVSASKNEKYPYIELSVSIGGAYGCASLSRAIEEADKEMCKNKGKDKSV